jgi:hypothetical protein
MPDSGITGITLTTDEESVTVTPEAFDRYARGVRTMPAATATRIIAPAEIDFEDGAAFLDSPELKELAGDLIELHPGTLGHLAEVEVAYLWKKTGGKRGGKGTFGKATKPSGLLTAFTSAEAVIWLAADHVADAQYSARQIEALLFHEMQHIGIEEEDETGERKVVMRAHDVELFFQDVKVYGAWEEMLAEAASAFKQAPLFGEG